MRKGKKSAIFTALSYFSSSRMTKKTELSPLIELKNIYVTYAQKKVLQNINFCLYPQSIITIVGPNGGGKSTLLKVLLKLLPPTSGEVMYHQNVRIGYVPQKIYLDHTLPLNVVKFLDLTPKVTKNAITHALHLLSISHLSYRSLHKLSGGEMQRVLLARAILSKPNLLVLDEPTQGVDLNGQAELYQLIHRVQKQLKCAVLMVSHDLHMVLADSDEVLCINQHICCHGTPESLTHNPKFVQLFGEHLAKNTAFYAHHHNHQHHMNGEICHSQHCKEK